MVTYGGDEVSAIVIDIGSSTTKAGYAGEEAPKCVIPTAYGWMNVEREVDDDADTTMPGAGGAATRVGGTDSNGDVDMDAAGASSGSANGSALPQPATQDQDPRVDPSASGSAHAAGGANGAERRKKVITEKRYFMGEDGVNVWRKGMEVDSFMRDGIIADPTPLPHHLSHVLHKSLCIDPADHPLFMSEPAWNTNQARETLAEIAFEGEGVPGFYIAASPVLTAFSAGKGSALVVDIGSDLVSVVPVTDGYAIRAGTKRQPLSMTLLHAQMAEQLRTSTPPIALTPHALIKSRKPVAPATAPDVVLNQARIDGTTASWRAWAENRVVEGWREGVAEVYMPQLYQNRAPENLNPDVPTGRPSKSYEFPNGYNQAFGDMRLYATEALFNPAGFLNKTMTPPSTLLSTPASPTSIPLTAVCSLTDLIVNSVLACDVDQRPVLLANIVVVGGGSLIPGLVDRINFEVSTRFPSTKIKIHAPGSTVERKYSAWLGGSILGSLGTAMQLIVGIDEYREHGAAILRQRCK